AIDFVQLIPPFRRQSNVTATEINGVNRAVVRIFQTEASVADRRQNRGIKTNVRMLVLERSRQTEACEPEGENTTALSAIGAQTLPMTELPSLRTVSQVGPNQFAVTRVAWTNCRLANTPIRLLSNIRSNPIAPFWLTNWRAPIAVPRENQKTGRATKDWCVSL